MALPSPAVPATIPLASPYSAAPVGPVDAADGGSLSPSSRRMSKSSADSSKTVVTQDPEKAMVAEKKTGSQTPRSAEADGTIWVDWDGPDDPQNPLNWTRPRKWAISSVGIMFCALVSMSVSAYATNIGSVTATFGCSRELSLLGITLFTLMFGTAPLILAPLSEVYGRSGIYLISAVIYTLFFIPQALAQNIQTILISRFLSGVAGSTAVSLVGGSLSDVWNGNDRGLPMSLFAYAAFAATGLGPVVFGYVELKSGFRLTDWILFAISSVFSISLVFILKESRASVILTRKAKKLRATTGDERYRSRGEAEMGSFKDLMHKSLARPIRMLFTETVLLSFSIYVSFVWLVLFILLESLIVVFEGVYGFNTGEAGLVFASQIVGSTLGLVIDHWCDKAYHKNVARKGPEARLYTAMVGAVLLPVGAFIYTFTSYSNVHWIAPCIGISLLYGGMYLIYLACFNYLAETYTLYAASALSGQSFLRNLVGAVTPLYASQMYSSLGIQGAGGLVAGVALLLSATPFVLYKYGAYLRSRSPFAKVLEAEGASHNELEE